MGTDKRLHVLQVVNWKRFSAADWVIQYGVWLNTPTYGQAGAGGGDSSPLAVMIDKADTKKVRQATPIRPDLQINDIEARAVSKVLQEMLARIDLDESRCAWYLILRYEHEWTDKALSIMEQCTLAAARKRQKKALEYFKKRTGCL